MSATAHDTEGKHSPPINALEIRAYRIPDACRVLAISRAHLYCLASKGKLRLVKIGGRTVIPATEIARILGEAA